MKNIKKHTLIFIFLILFIIILTYTIHSFKKPIISDISPEIISIKPFEACISWESKDLSKGRIYYNTVNDNATTISAEEYLEASYRHEIILTGLNPSTRYTYWIDKSNLRFQFQTQPLNNNPFSFILIVGDILDFDIKELIVSELPEFLFCIKPDSKNNSFENNSDLFKDIRPYLQIFNLNGPDLIKKQEQTSQKHSWRLQWGGLDLIVLNQNIEELAEIKKFLATSNAHTTGILTNADSSSLNPLLIDHNQKHPSNPVSFVINFGNNSDLIDQNGIKYVFIPVNGKQPVRVMRFDVDVDLIKANFINEGKEIFLKSPPLKQKRTCEECRRLADKGAYEESIKAYQDFIASHKGHFQIEDAYYAIASIYDEKLFQFKQALFWYNRLIAEYPGGTLSSLAKQRVNFLMEYNEYDFEPLTQFERIKKIEFGRQIKNLQSREKILKQVETIINKYPKCKLAPVMQYWLGHQYREISIQKAVKSYLDLKQNFPNHLYSKEVMIDIADTYYQSGKYSEALMTYQKAAEELKGTNQTIISQIQRCNRNILRDRLSVVFLCIFIIFLLSGFFSKPFNLGKKMFRSTLIMAIIAATILFIYGYLIREQFSSVKEIYLFSFIIPMLVWLSTLFSLCVSNHILIWNKIPSFWGRLFIRTIAGVLFGVLYFFSGVYLLIYYIDVHYLIVLGL